EVLDDDVGAAGQLEDELATLGSLKIDRDAALPAIDRGERRAHPVATPGAQIVAAAGTLHLHDVGAQVRHERRAVRARDHARKIEDADSVQHNAPSASIEEALRHRVDLGYAGARDGVDPRLDLGH